MAKKDEEKKQRTRMPKGKELIGRVDDLLGAKRMRVECSDGRTRMCRIPGKAQRRMWVKEGNHVIVEPWKIQGDEKGDIIWKYRKHQVQELRRKGMLDEIE